jgi:hypothetical protein
MRMMMRMETSSSKEREEFWGKKQSEMQTVVSSWAEIEELLTYLSQKCKCKDPREGREARGDGTGEEVRVFSQKLRISKGIRKAVGWA